MWICFDDAFVSAVQDRNNPNQLVVRARKREHLQTLFPGHEVISTPDADYAARVFVTREEFASLVARRIGQIEYDNFKNSVSDLHLHGLYADFWSLHWRYQQQAVCPDRSRHFAWGPGDIKFTREQS